MNIQAINSTYGKTFSPKKAEKKSVHTPNTDTKTEKLEISSKSSELQLVKSEVDKTSDVRLQVVKEIRARIKSNDYPLENNLDAMVKKMIKSHVLEA